MTLRDIFKRHGLNDCIHAISGFAHKGNRYAVAFYLDDSIICALYLRSYCDCMPIDLPEILCNPAYVDFIKAAKAEVHRYMISKCAI